MKRILKFMGLFLLAGHLSAQISVNPSGVNVSTNSATTVFLTFARVSGKIPVEAIWCGDLIDAAPAIGRMPAPGTIFGQLPIRYNLSQMNGDNTFTDIMSIPLSVSKRAYQAAKAGETSSFFYVRRFIDPSGGPDEYVAVTCRLTGGGARVPFALLDVTLINDEDDLISYVKVGEDGPKIGAHIYYNGTGRLKGRWEVVLPGDTPPTEQDLLTEGTLPPSERGLQRRYLEVGRFNHFLPPTGSFVLPGPDPERLPTEISGLHMLLLRIEATEDKEGNSVSSNFEEGSTVIYSGGVAGFPIPPYRYFVNSDGQNQAHFAVAELELLQPESNATLPANQPIQFSWSDLDVASAYLLEIKNPKNELIFSAALQKGTTTYQTPSWLLERLGSAMNWQVTALGKAGTVLQTSKQNSLSISQE